MSEHPFLAALRATETLARTGRVTRILPTSIEADGPGVPIGTLCDIAAGETGLLARVAAVRDDAVVLVPFEDATAAFPGAPVVARPHGQSVPVGDAFLGRAVDAFGDPLDSLGPLAAAVHRPLHPPLPSPLDRVSPDARVDTGIRALDGLLTLGRGQRVGIFAAAGVGKTSLLAQLARQVEADRCVLCLVGERGREVEALWAGALPDEVRARTVLVAATSDRSAATRARACDYALALADHWRSEGHHVLLLLDSVTRLAMALRELGLAAGEPPTVRAYPPSVFSALPRVAERCGALRGGGAITAAMTILAETDDNDDPIVEVMKSLLDGHVVLSRTLAERGQFPAIDVPRSISRLASALLDADDLARAREAAALLSTYESSRMMIEAGVYVPGSSAEVDSAVAARPGLLDFLRQGEAERSTPGETRAALAAALSGAGR